MLSPDHVRTRKKGGEIELIGLSGKTRKRAADLAAEMLAAARDFVGERRGTFEEALRSVEAKPSERKLVNGLAKLVLDACELEAPTELDAAALRRTLFERAAAARSELGPGEEVDRAALVSGVAGELAVDAEAVERAMFADLKSEERVVGAPSIDPERLLERYERGARQALLLRAVRVTAFVRCGDPHAYRTLFRQLKFRRLLHRIEPAEGGYRIVVDGPFSLFESVTKYGLALALVLPALEACDELRLVADLSWGPRRERLLYRYERRGVGADAKDAPLSDDVRALLDGFDKMQGKWRARPSTRLVDLPGLGVIVPDIELTRERDGARVLLEVLGFWSREAVFRRVELAERGLPEKILFAASSRLRVSEELLDDEGSAALYVYKGVMSPRAVERHLERLAARTPVV
jgi:predicted nuclease of restriction endonuclease-like RecB superfamily